MVEKFEGDNREWLRLLKSHALVENVGIALRHRAAVFSAVPEEGKTCVGGLAGADEPGGVLRIGPAVGGVAGRRA